MSIRITPIAGGVGDPGPALCFLLELDGARILLDCGARDRPPECGDGDDDPSAGDVDDGNHQDRQRRYVDDLARLAPTLDLVVLTHPLLGHLGALPYLKSKAGLRCQVYATLPVKEMGRWAVHEWCRQRSSEEDVALSEPRETGDFDVTPDNGDTVDGRRASKKRKLLDRKSLHLGGTQGDGKGSAGQTRDDGDVFWRVSADDVQNTFDSIIGVRYSQPIHLAGNLNGLTLVAHRAGHTLGGALWTLRSPLHSVATSASPTLLYAPVLNLADERHLDGTALVVKGKGAVRIGEGMGRPGILLVGAEHSLAKGLKKKDKEAVFLDSVTATLRSSHSVLIPCDPSARLFEILTLLDQHWSTSRLDAYPLCLVSSTGQDVLGFVRSLTEWLGKAASTTGDDFVSDRRTRHDHRTEHGQRDTGPARFRHVKWFPSPDALARDLPAGIPKLVIAVPGTLSHGYSRQLFVSLAASAGNLVVLPSRSEEGSLTRWLSSKIGSQARNNTEAVPRAVHIDEELSVEIRSKVPLTGAELAEHLENQRKADQVRKQLAQARAVAPGVDDDSESDDSDEEGEPAGRAMESADAKGGVRPAKDSVHRSVMAEPGGQSGGLDVSRRGLLDEFVDEGDISALSFDIYVRNTAASRPNSRLLTQRFRMFPYVERRRRVDAYGEVIDVDGWLRRGEDAGDKAKEESRREGKRERPEDSKPAEVPPTKFVSVLHRFQPLCSFLLLDLDGKVDGRALKTLVPQINPKAAIFVGCSPASAEDLTASCAAMTSFTDSVFSPTNGTSCEVGDDIKSLPVRLSDALISSLRMSKVESFEVVHINAMVESSPEAAMPILERFAGFAAAAPAKDHPRVQRAVPEVSDSVIRLPALPASSVFIGDLRLAALKTRLAAAAISGSLAGGGVLVCRPAASVANSDAVLVKKAQQGELVVEGVAGQLFADVRRIVYSLHAST